MNYDVNKTAARVKFIRKNKGITQEVAANEMNISIKTYQAIEQGSRGTSIDTICMIAHYFGISIDYLVGNDVTTNKEIDGIVNGLSAEQKRQILEIMRCMVVTLRWK